MAVQDTTTSASSYLACLAVLMLVLTLCPLPVGGAPAYKPSGPVAISGDDDWPYEEAVSGGSGTSSDPYVIEGLEISPSSRLIGISIHHTRAHVVIRGCHITNCSNGVVLYNVSNARVENSIITDCGMGVTVSYSEDCSVVGNNISRCEIGVGVYYSDHVRVKSNIYLDNIEDFDERKKFAPWETTWVGTVVCMAILVPIAILVTLAVRFRIASKKARVPPGAKPPP